MAYVLLFFTLLIWAVFAFRDEPLREYARVYFVGGFLAYAAEFTLSGVFRLYTYRSGWIADPFRDERLMAFFVLLGIDPLMVVLSVHYSKRRPVVGAVVSAAIVAVLEIIFAWFGQMRYPVGWGPILSFLVSVPAFWGMWALKAGVFRLPHWLHVHAMAFWCAMPINALLNGALGWFYLLSPVPITGSWRIDSRIASFLYAALVRAPVATLVAIGPWRNRWVAAGIGVAFLALLQVALLYTRFLVFPHWNLVLGMLLDSTMVIPPILYARWIMQGDHERIERWVPPVLPRGGE